MESKKRKRSETGASVTSQNAVSKKSKHEHLFSGPASQLDPKARSTYIASKAAQEVILAIARGDADAINRGHAPNGLSKIQRSKWRDSQRKLALQRLESPPDVDPPQSSAPNESAAMQNIPKSKESSKKRKRRKERRQLARRQALEGPQIAAQDPLAHADEDVEKKSTSHRSVNVGTSETSASSSSSSESSAENEKAAAKSRAIGFTPLLRPPSKVWHFSKPQQSIIVQENTTTNVVINDGDVKEDTQKIDHTLSASEAPTLGLRRSSQASSTLISRVRSREAASTVAPRRLAGNRNFDVPDFFVDGNLEDTQRRFEAWARAQRGGQSDSSDDESESSDDDGDEEAESSAKVVVRGSFHESWAEEISAKATEHGAKGRSEKLQVQVDEHAVESSDSENEESEAESQVSEEMEEKAVAATDDASADVEEQSASNENIVESSVEDDATADVPDPAADTKDVISGQPTDQSPPNDPKIRPSTPDQRPSGTTTGHPNTTRQANFRVKRTLSQTDLGGSLSGRGPTEVGKPKSKPNAVTARAIGVSTQRDRLDNGELSDDVYDAIDDVTSSLVGSISAGPAQEMIPSLNQCKPYSNNGQDDDPLTTNDASVSETANLDERVDVMKEIEENDAGEEQKSENAREDDGFGSARRRKAEWQDYIQIPTFKTSESEPPSSPSKSPSKLSRVSSLRDAELKPTGGRSPQVVISPYVPGTPEVKPDDSAKKKRKMTGNSSKHFSSTAKRIRATRQSMKLEESPSPATPEVLEAPAVEDGSSIYQTAVSRRTRSAVKNLVARESEPEENEIDEAETPKQHLRPPQHPDPEACSPLSALEEALNAKTRATPSGVDEDNQPNAKQADIDPSSPQEFITPAAEPQTPDIKPSNPKSKSKRKSTSRISHHFITDRVDLPSTLSPNSTTRKTGLSTAPIPPLSTPTFGLIQEKLWQEPFWLLIAVTFLNKTTGRSAVPIFWKLKEKYATPEDLAKAEQGELLEMIWKLGLQNQRSKRLVKMAEAWCGEEPVKGKRFRTLNYPNAGDGKARDVPNVVEEDAEDCSGALEIGHMPGCGDYAWDSWRIFCRDVLRGVAEDYNGLNSPIENFESEWKRALPKDKELRACLRWMWMKEGIIWDPLTGEKRPATNEEITKAERGEMEIWDPQERKFAAQAAERTLASDEKAPTKPNKDTSFNQAEGEEEEEEEQAEDALQLATELATATETATHSSPSHASSSSSGNIVVKTRRPPSRAVKVEPSVEVEVDVNTPSIRKKKTNKEAKVKDKRHDDRMDEEPTKSASRRKPRTSSFCGDDDEDFEREESSKSRRRSKRLSMA